MSPPMPTFCGKKLFIQRWVDGELIHHKLIWHKKSVYYDPVSNNFIFLIQEKRCAAPGLGLDPKSWLIAGGGTTLYSSEIFDSTTNSFSYYPVDLPIDDIYHNLIQINSTHFIALCGYYDYPNTYLYNMNTEVWTDGPSLSSATDKACQSGLVTFGNGSKAKKINNKTSRGFARFEYTDTSSILIFSDI